jgi:hypothetical protein
MRGSALLITAAFFVGLGLGVAWAEWGFRVYA